MWNNFHLQIFLFQTTSPSPNPHPHTTHLPKSYSHFFYFLNIYRLVFTKEARNRRKMRDGIRTYLTSYYCTLQLPKNIKPQTHPQHTHTLNPTRAIKKKNELLGVKKGKGIFVGTKFRKHKTCNIYTHHHS